MFIDEIISDIDSQIKALEAKKQYMKAKYGVIAESLQKVKESFELIGNHPSASTYIDDLMKIINNYNHLDVKPDNLDETSVTEPVDESEPTQSSDDNLVTQDDELESQSEIIDEPELQDDPYLNLTKLTDNVGYNESEIVIGFDKARKRSEWDSTWTEWRDYITETFEGVTCVRLDDDSNVDGKYLLLVQNVKNLDDILKFDFTQIPPRPRKEPKTDTSETVEQETKKSTDAESSDSEDLSTKPSPIQSTANPNVLNYVSNNAVNLFITFDDDQLAKEWKTRLSSKYSELKNVQFVPKPQNVPTDARFCVILGSVPENLVPPILKVDYTQLPEDEPQQTPVDNSLSDDIFKTLGVSPDADFDIEAF